MLARQPWEALRAPLIRAGADADPALARLREFARRLLEWNRQVSNIMSRHDEERIVERHLLESIAPAHWLREAGLENWLDFGTGAGLPAIPLAIAGVGARWTLVESRRTKTLFLRKTIENMALHGFDVVNDRLENLVRAEDLVPSLDGFTSRATIRLGPTLALAARIVRPGGVAFLWKGSGREDEMEGHSGWRDHWEFDGTLPAGSGPTVVARFTRK